MFKLPTSKKLSRIRSLSRKLERVQKLEENQEKMSGKAEDVSISIAAVTIIITIADISRALAVCQALSPESHILT